MLEYEDCDENGMPLVRRSGASARPKWMLPEGDFQKRFLDVVGLRYFPDHASRSRVVMIEKTMSSYHSFERMPLLPAEWVDEQIAYVRKARNHPDPMRRKMIGLPGLLTMIENADRLQQWKDRHFEAGRREYVAGVKVEPQATETVFETKINPQLLEATDVLEETGSDPLT